MGQIWDAFKKSYKTEGLTGAKTVTGAKAYAFETGYRIGSEVRISGFDTGYVRNRAGLKSNQQVLALMANLKWQRYFVSSGYLKLFNQQDTLNGRSRILAKNMKRFMANNKLEEKDVPARASYQAANPAKKDTEEVKRYGGTDKWIKEVGGEAKDIKVPSFPSFTLPKMPSFNLGGIKQSMQIIAIVIMLFIAAIIYIIFVRGKGLKGVEVSAVGK